MPLHDIFLLRTLASVGAKILPPMLSYAPGGRIFYVISNYSVIFIR